MANTKKRTTGDTLGEAMAARLAGQELNRNAVVSALAQASDRDEKAKLYQAQKAAEVAQKAQAAAQVAAEQAKKKQAAMEAFRSSIGQKADVPQTTTAKDSYAAVGKTLPQSQLDNAAINYTANESRAAAKDHDTYMKSEERKSNVDAATNEVLKKVFGNLGSGNLDLSLQNAPGQILNSDTQDKEKTLEARKDYAEQQLQTAKNTRILNTDKSELSAWSQEDKEGLEAYIREEDALQNRQNWDILSNDTNSRSNALIRKYGYDKVKEMAESYRWQQSAKLAQQAQQAGVDGADNGVLSTVAHNVGSVGANLAGAISAPLGYVQELGQRTGRYATLNPNNIGQLPSVYASGVRNQTAENIEKSDALRRVGDALAGAAAYTQTGELPSMKVYQPEKEGESSTAGKVASTIYQAGMTAADSLARAAAGGGGTVIPAILSAGQSFGSTVSQASRQGASPGQALALGAVNAGIEAATEKYSLENLLSTARNGTSGIAGLLKNAAIQGGIELSEEEASLAGTTLAERLILGKKSAYNQKIQEGIANGLSYADAKAAADKALLSEAGETALISALSGSMSAAGATLAAHAPDIKQSVQDKGQEAIRRMAESMLQVKEQNTAGDTAKTDALGIKKNTAPVDGANVQTAIKNPTYEELTGKKDMPIVNVGRNTEGKSYAQLKTDALQKATNEKWFDEPHTNTDTGMPIFLTNKTFTHAFSNLRSDFGTDTILAMNHLPELIRDAVLTNVADPKDTSKSEDKVYTFMAAIQGEKGTEPVKLTVKEYTHKKGLNLPQNILNYFNRVGASDKHSRLYDVKALEVVGIEKAETENEFGASGSAAERLEHSEAKATPNSTIRIADLLRLVKGDAEKYIPKQVNGNLPDYSPQRMGTERQSAEGGQQKATGIPGDFEAMGAASAGFSGVQGYDELLYDGNVQPERATDAKHEEMPIQDGYGREVSEFGANVINSEVISERDVNTVKQLVADGAFGHDVQKMDDVRQAAMEEINRKGKAAAVMACAAAADNGKINEHMIAQAQLLFAHYTNQDGAKAQEMASELLVDLSQMATQAGRQLNMFKLLRQLTPEGQLLTVQKEVDRAVQNMVSKGKVKEGASPEIPVELQQEYVEAAKEAKKATTPAETEAARKKQEETANAIYASAAAQLDTTFKGKWDTWRYMAMMGNLKTNVRNILGNAAMIPYTEVKRALGTAMEKAIPKDKRTKAVMGLSKSDRDLMQWAKDDSRMYTVENALKYSAKLGDDVTGDLMQENVKVFDNALLENFRKITEKAPAAGDMLFKKAEYAKSLAGFLKAKGYAYADIQNGNISAETLSEARDYAISEAMKATFNDCNAFSDFMSGLRYTGDNIFGKALNILGEGVLPFRRTPANIVVRFTEYSPVGIAKGLGNLVTKVRSGEMSAATAIDQLSAGMTGTGAAAIGYMLASVGVLKGSGVSEEEEEQGHQKYALEFTIDGKTYSYTIDWAAPANLPLFLGANMYELFQQQGDGSVSSFTNFVYNMGTMFEPMLQLSCLSSLNDLFEAGKYAGEGEVLYAVASQAATSYLTQGIPSLIRQADQTAHENKQQTFANSSDPLLRDAQRTAANIPFLGDAFQVDSVDEWGNAVSRGNVGQRIFDAFANPGTAKQVDTGALETELSRLSEAQEENVRPPEVAKTISYTDADGNKHTNERLTAEQYTTLKTVQGQTAQGLLAEMISSESYKALTDEQKAEAFGYVYDYAREKARTEAIQDYEGLDGWMEGIEGNEVKAIMDKILSGSLSDAFSSLTQSWKNGGEADVSGELESAYATYKGMTDEEKAAFKEDNSGRIAKYLEAREHGIKTDTFLDLYESYYALDKNEDLTQTEKAAEWALTVQKAREAGKINDNQKDHLRGSLTFRYSMEAETEKFDAMTDAGISADDAQDLGYLLSGLLPETGYKNVRDIQKAESIMDSSLSEADKIAALKVYGSDAQDKNLEEMKAMGFSAADYVEAWRIYADGSGTGKKARAIAEYQKVFGVDKATAKAIYEIYG